MKYFSYDPTDGGYGFELHDTAEKAKLRAQSCIPDLIDCDGRWAEEIDQLCWGEVKEIATKTDIQPVDENGCLPDGEYVGDEFSLYCDYELKQSEKH